MEGIVTQDDGASSSSASNFAGSRRRIAFRQPQAAPAQRERDKLTSPSIPTSSASPACAPEASHTSQNPEANHAPTPDGPEDEEDRRQKRIPWNTSEVSAFFEGIKTHGKDFESVSKVMARRNVIKSREEVKAFFANSCKTYIKLLTLTEEETLNVGRDAKELFLMVNACEWKKKTLNHKIIIEKFRELLFEGVTMVKIGAKRVFLRTPSCPSLCRYFHSKKADRIPSELFVQLEPTANEDHNFVRRRQCNPFVRLKMNANDRITQLIEFLCLKWTVQENSSPISLTLWPDRSCEIASLSIQPVEADPQVAPSLSKLVKKFADDGKDGVPAKNEMKKPYEIPRYLVGSEVNTSVKASHTITYSKPFILTDAIVAEGINFRNCKVAIIAELYCVCGLKNPIKMRYQVRSELPDSVPTNEPWSVMIELLRRGYGDSLRDSRRDAEVEERNRRKACREPQPRRRRARPPAPVKAPVPPPPPIPPPTDVVGMENEDFETQLARLRKVTRKTTVSVKRQNDAAATQIIKTITRPLPIAPSVAPERPPVRQLFAAPKSIIVPKKTPVRMPTIIRPLQTKQPHQPSSKTLPPSTSSRPGPSSFSGMPTDFSGVFNSPNKPFSQTSDAELQRKRTDNFLSSLRTPDATPGQTPRKNIMEQFFGGELSMSPGSTRQDASLFETPDDGTRDNGSMIDFTDMMYQQIEDTEASFSNTAIDITASDQVHKTYQDMYGCSQDSQDYIYRQFVKKKTPKKAPAASKRK